MSVRERLRICLVGPLAPPSGGMATQLAQVSTLLRDEGHAVEVVANNAPCRPAWLEKVRGARAVFRLYPYVFRLWVAAGRNDVVHVLANSGWAWWLFAVPAVLIARWRRTPVIVNYHGGGAFDFFSRARPGALAILRAADALVVPSAFLRDVFAHFGVEAEIIPNVIDTRRFAPAPGGRTKGRFHVVVTRNFDPVYDIPTVLRAFAIAASSIADAHLSVTGSGPERSRLEALCTELGIAGRVSFTGRIDNSAIHRLYQSADLMVNPSLVDNQPVSILEAFACGVHVVSTNVGGVPLVAEHERTALLVPPGDPRSMAQAMLRIAGDAQLAEGMASAGLEESRKYDWSGVGPAWASCYRRLTARTGPGSAECA